jgi:hypothetical protein
MAVGLLLHIYPRNCKGQCCMVIALIFRDVAKHMKFGGGGCRMSNGLHFTKIMTFLHKFYQKMSKFTVNLIFPEVHSCEVYTPHTPVSTSLLILDQIYYLHLD